MISCDQWNWWEFQTGNRNNIDHSNPLQNRSKLLILFSKHIISRNVPELVALTCYLVNNEIPRFFFKKKTSGAEWSRHDLKTSSEGPGQVLLTLTRRIHNFNVNGRDCFLASLFTKEFTKVLRTSNHNFKEFIWESMYIDFQHSYLLLWMPLYRRKIRILI